MFERFAQVRLKEALEDTPVVLVQGPRQCGKTTLVRQFSGDCAPFVTLDDPLALDAATRNPDSFLSAFRGPVVIDEVQRAPGLFRAIKKAVDVDRSPGRFLLTGSSNVLVHPKLSESLAGRMETIPLWPLSQAEVHSGGGGFLDSLFQDVPVRATHKLDVWDAITGGGFPEPLARKSPTRRAAWFESYVRTVTERDVRDLADIEGLTAMPRLLRTLATQSGETINVSRLSRELGFPHTTLTRYLSLLESVFLLRPLPAWGGPGVRSIKSAKLHFADPGVLAWLLGADPERLKHDLNLKQRLLEAFVAMECVRLADSGPIRYRVLHFRSVRHWSVPVVIESPDGRIAGISVCTDATPTPEDFRGLEFLQEIAGESFVYGLVLHTGGGSVPIGDRLTSAPVSVIKK